MIKQTIAVLLLSLRSIPSRIAPSFIIVVGIGGVVAVLMALMSLAQGFQATLAGTGANDRALILRSGSTSEINGTMPIEHYEIIRDFPGVATLHNEKLAAMETFVTVNMRQRSTPIDASIPMRGITAESFLVRPEVKIVAGRAIEFGKFELIAGTSAANQFEGIDLNSMIKIRGVDWLVVGYFSASGGAYDSEIWVDHKLLAASWHRGTMFSSMRVQLDNAAQFSAFKELVSTDKRLTAQAVRESDFYADQSKNTTNLITGVGILVGTIMAIGAVFAALNSMYTSLSSRTVEIATLRALGFHRLPLLISVLIESALVGSMGALLGGLLVYFTLNNVSVSTVAATSATFTQVAFKFMVTPDLLLKGIVLAILLALIGGFFPALGAVRKQIVDGLRYHG